jgi:hypothetical protein
MCYYYGMKANTKTQNIDADPIGTLYHPAVIRQSNGGHLFPAGRVGGVIVARAPSASPLNRRAGCRHWSAVVMTAIGGASAPGVYMGDYASRELATAAARERMLANGWYVTYAEAEVAVQAMIAADSRSR